jgi:hypothetical protein
MTKERCAMPDCNEDPTVQVHQVKSSGTITLNMCQRHFDEHVSKQIKR